MIKKENAFISVHGGMGSASQENCPKASLDALHVFSGDS
jgi:hypothetical protein